MGASDVDEATRHKLIAHGIDPATREIDEQLQVYQQQAAQAQRRQELEQLRDQFAMAALTGMLDNGKGGTFFDSANDFEVSKSAYRYADAMLEARKESGEGE